MRGDAIPIAILGGSDLEPVELPEEGRDKHPLSGYKGIDIRIQGRPLIEILVERLRLCGKFAPIYLAGPAAVYGHLAGPQRIVDTDGNFGQNIRAAIEAVRSAHPGMPVAFVTCDILPEVRALRTLMQDHERHTPCDLWVPLIRAPEDPQRLGAFGWKPSYRILPEAGEPAVPVLPGHLLVVDPAALRLKFLYRLFQIGYRTRNRSIGHRRSAMVRGVLLGLLRQDLLRVFTLRPPNLTWNVLRAGLGAGRELKAGTITRGRLEDAVRRLFVRRRHRRRFPERRAALPILEELSIARDIDTEEEARELGGELSRDSA